MKEALEGFFKRLLAFSQSTFGTFPTVCFTADLNRDLMISAPDEDGEAEWRPVLQKQPVDWRKIEDRLGFRLCDELKEYYSVWSFPVVTGKFGSSTLTFYGVNAVEQVEKTVLQEYADAQYVFPDSQIFLLGHAVIQDQDDYFIYFDNTTQKVFCYESDTGKEVLLAYSLAGLFDRMEASI
ncbi:MAG: SecY-interacting protein Syd [Erysipelotrichaceae bacterium]|nr:SecY-interacting protein Syd [Erysipelotrichaceae bacterium]